MSLFEKLAALDTLLVTKVPEIHGSLKPGANPEKMKKLKIVLGDQFKDDLRIWFSWHDGQEEFSGFDIENNMELLNISSAIEAYKFLNDPKEEVLQPYKSSWFPICESPGGDYLVFDLKTEILLEWRHDEKERPVVAKNFSEYVDQLLKDFKNYEPEDDE